MKTIGLIISVPFWVTVCSLHIWAVRQLFSLVDWNQIQGREFSGNTEKSHHLATVQTLLRINSAISQRQISMHTCGHHKSNTWEMVAWVDSWCHSPWGFPNTWTVQKHSWNPSKIFLSWMELEFWLMGRVQKCKMIDSVHWSPSLWRMTGSPDFYFCPMGS